MSNLATSLQVIDTIIETALGAGLGLRPGASDLSGLDGIDDDLVAALTPLLVAADGQEHELALDLCLDWLPQGMRLLSVDEIVSIWNYELSEQDEDYEDDWHQDDDRVRGLLTHPRRVMLWGDPDFPTEGGGYLDGVPGPNGRVGQVIAAVSECDFEVVAWSLDDFFSTYAELVKSGQLVVSKGAYSWCVQPPGVEEHPDALLQAFRAHL